MSNYIFKVYITYSSVSKYFYGYINAFIFLYTFIIGTNYYKIRVKSNIVIILNNYILFII